MHDILTAAILGIVEGATEFLPISSTGHLIIFNQWFAFEESFTKLFDIVIQSGAILAVIIIFWKDLWPEKWDWKSLEDKWGKIFAAFAITSVFGILFSDVIDRYLFSPWVVALMLIVYGVVFFIVESKSVHDVQRIMHNDEKRKVDAGFQALDLGQRTMEVMSYSHAVLIGLAQALAMVPGTSRSGATIIAMLLLGYTRVFAVRFSFLLAVPTLMAAGGFSLLKYEKGISGSEYWLLAIGFVVSFITAYAVSKWFVDYIKNKTFLPFTWYRIVLGLLMILLLLY